VEAMAKPSAKAPRRRHRGEPRQEEAQRQCAKDSGRGFPRRDGENETTHPDKLVGDDCGFGV